MVVSTRMKTFSPEIMRVLNLTTQLVQRRSCPFGPKEDARLRIDNQCQGENDVADFIKGHFAQLGIKAFPLDFKHPEYGFERKNVAAFLPGNGTSKKTLLLFGHIDTVGIDEFTDLIPMATEPDQLAVHIESRLTANPDALADLQSGDWLWGRGTFDMKAGVAVHMEAMRRLKENPVDGNILFLGTPDEENESAGMMAAIPQIRAILERNGLTASDMVGAINADYTTQRSANDANRYLYLGTIGKVLPCFLVVGMPTHVGEPYNGIAADYIVAELIHQIEYNVRLCECANGELTQPPSSLKLTDLKGSYDVQTPFMAWAYFNWFTHRSTPEQIMEKMIKQAEIVAARVKRRFDQSRASFASRLQRITRKELEKIGRDFDKIEVVTPQQLLAQGLEINPTAADKAQDLREKSRLIVTDLWEQSKRPGPAIIPFLAPPYYPHGLIANREKQSPLLQAVDVVTRRFKAAELPLEARYFYPYISDNSFLRVPLAGAELDSLMPLWGRGYSLPLEFIRELNLPVVNIGPWGKDAHQLTERVHIPYSFGILPDIMEQVIRETLRK